jgi:hypothetical protein
MPRSKFLLGTILGLACFASGVLVAQGARHPNLRAAQQLVDQAFQRISDAQRANEWDMSGHAARAKDLLGQASWQPKRPTTTTRASSQPFRQEGIFRVAS